MDMTTKSRVQGLLEDIAKAGGTFAQNEPGAREHLLDLAYSLAAAVELPSESIQRIGWAEASLPTLSLACPEWGQTRRLTGRRSPPAMPC